MMEIVKQAMAIGAVQVPEELNALAELVKQHQPKNILEIGSEAGGTFYLWCQLAKLGGLKISLDLPTGNSGSGKFVDAQALAARTSLFRSWSANVCVVTGDSHSLNAWADVSDILRGEKLDFLFLDGDHSYLGVKDDCLRYREFVRPGGLIAFHDIVDSEFHRRRGCFVAKFWAELKAAKESEPRTSGFHCDRLTHEFNQGLEWGGIGVVTV